MEQYSLEAGKLCIKDSALGLDICEMFEPELIEHDHFSVPKKQGACKWVKKDPHGKAIQIAHSLDGRFHGPLYHYFSDGSLASLTWFYKGRRIGKREKYFPVGALYARTLFSLEGAKVHETFWYDNGQVRSDISYEKGRVQGGVRLFWPNGHLKRECTCEGGQKIGEERFFDKEGKLITQGALAHDA